MTGSPEPRLTEQRVLDAAGQQSFARGEQYTAYVRGLRVVGATVQATIQAKNVHLVGVDWSGGALTGSCTCPQGLAGAFCKHQVAVALSVLDNRPPATADEGDPVTTLLDRLTNEQLRALVRDLVERDPGAVRILAWNAVHRYGAGHLLQPLAELSAEQRPREAAELYRPGLEEALRYPDTSKYAGIADRLVTMRELYRAAGGTRRTKSS